MLQFKRKSVLQVAKKCKCLRMFSKGLYSLQHKNCYCNTACNKIKLFFFLHQQKYVSTELIMNQLGQVSAISFWQQNETWWNFKKVYAYLRSSHRTCFVKKVFWRISQISQENTCARGSFLIKLGASGFNLILSSIEATVQPSMFKIKEQPKHWFGIFLLLKNVSYFEIYIFSWAIKA